MEPFSFVRFELRHYCVRRPTAAHLCLGTGVRGQHPQSLSHNAKKPACGSPHSAGIAICSPRDIGDPHDMRPRGSQHLSCAAICLRRGLPQGGGGWINISDFRARKSFPISDLRRRARRLSVNVVVTCALPVVAALKNGARARIVDPLQASTGHRRAPIRTPRPNGGRRVLPFMYQLIASMSLTGWVGVRGDGPRRQ